MNAQEPRPPTLRIQDGTQTTVILHYRNPALYEHAEMASSFRSLLDELKPW